MDSGNGHWRTWEEQNRESFLNQLQLSNFLIERVVPQGFFAAVVYTIAQGIGFLMLFSTMLPYYQFGARVYRGVQDTANEAFILMGCSVGALFLLYVFDFAYWTGFLRRVGYVIICLSVMGIGGFSLLMLEVYPGAPMLYFALLPPVLGAALKQAWFPDDDVLWFVLGAIVGLVVNTVVVGTLWVVWMVTERKWWNADTRTLYVNVMQCEFNISAVDSAADGSLYELPAECTRALITWIAPVLLCAYSVALVAVLVLLYRMETRRRRSRKAVGLEPIAQAFIAFTLFTVISMWIAASVAAAQLVDFSSFLLAISLVALIVSVFTVYAVVGFKYLKAVIKETALGTIFFKIIDSDWVKAVFVYLLSFLYVVELLLSLITQFVRKYSPLGKQINRTDKERGYWLKKETVEQLETLKSWNWGSILPKTWWIGIIFFTVVVLVGKLTIVFFSFLQDVLSIYPLFVTTAIFVAIGLTMFLLPPIPGVPVYVTGGIILTEQAERQQGWDFGIALLYSIMVCYVLKLLAVAIQQKAIGEFLGSRSPYVRSMLNINAVEMKAMRYILQKPGLNKKKVIILCSGPDWPTSVLTGIMRLKLSQMIIGSLPVIILVIPVTVAGAVINKSDEGVFKVLNPIFLLLAVIFQTMAGLLAFHYIAAEAKYNDEVKAIPDDPDILSYDRENEERRKLGKELYAWENLHPLVKVGHVVTTLCMIISCVGFQIFASRTFTRFTVESSIEVDLQGNFLNLFILPYALILFVIFGVGLSYMIVFSFVQSRRIKKSLKRIKAEEAATFSSQEIEL